eukprot:CAMPEP_0206145020 /NCGR_PEP_ID=MMETSP1473-20131121/26142_1 /ASSEMBLY_ACC=CAM_ASM_001109 /TAXON_ID=1461547 /ORGANISM="Stichococcus sp, Strain RCC1054" /LENGTH=636 /DNA_ID=CAMNT_0053541071 /DNA_START=476 /DNA_END=2386 /DNA_ORIENTATION=-
MQWASIRTPGGQALRVQYLRHLPPSDDEVADLPDTSMPPDFAPHVRNSNGDLVGAFGSEVCLGSEVRSTGSGAGIGTMSRGASAALEDDVRVSAASDDIAPAPSRSSSGSPRLASADSPRPRSGSGGPTAAAGHPPVEATAACSPAAGAGASAASPNGGVTPVMPRQHMQRQQWQRQQARNHPEKWVPERQRLLIIANPGTAAGAGWFTHVAEHFARIKLPGTQHLAAEVVTFDNRRLWPASGSAPVGRQQGGTTEAMAEAALGLMDALGWPHAHLTGMSLGAMVAAKAAAAAPNRVDSLTLLGYTTNGWQMAASLISRPIRLAQVLVGTRRSKLRAKLRFYFTDAFLSMPAPQPLPAPADSAAPVAVSDHSDQPPSVEMQRPTSGSGDAQPAADRRAAVDGPTAAVRPSTGTEAIPGEAVANRSKPSEGWSGAPQSPPHHAKRGVMGGWRSSSGTGGGTASRQEAMLRQALLRDEGGSDSDSPPGPPPLQADPARGGSGGTAVRGDANADLRDAPAGELPDTGLKGHSMTCLMHWLTRRESRAIAAAPFPKVIITGRHDPVARPRWVAEAAKRMRCSLLVTEASHAGLTVESCVEVLAALECSLFGGTVAAPATREAAHRAAIADAASNPHLIKR